MDRIRYVALTAITALAIAACGEPPPPATIATDLLFLSAGSGVAVVEPGADEPNYSTANGVPSRDWKTVVRANYATRGVTRVIGIDSSNGDRTWEQEVERRQRVKIVSDDGRSVALGPLNERFYSQGRTKTTLTIARADEGSRTFELEGNYEPEAFSSDGNSVFVISYLPPRAPTSYQVRRLDLNTGKVVGVYTPDAHLQQAMGGTARIQVASPDGKRLYTLYTLRGEDGSRKAFVHVLSLDNLWAHCIDLPEGFGRSSEATTALSVSPDGKKLFAANSIGDIVTEVDTVGLRVDRSRSVSFADGGRMHAISGADTVYVANSSNVTAIDTGSLEVIKDIPVFDRVSGLQLSAEAEKLYVGLRKEVLVLDAVSLLEVDVVDPPGMRRIGRFGPVMQRLDKFDQYGKITCAC